METHAGAKKSDDPRPPAEFKWIHELDEQVYSETLDEDFRDEVDERLLNAANLVSEDPDGLPDATLDAFATCSTLGYLARRAEAQRFAEGRELDRSMLERLNDSLGDSGDADDVDEWETTAANLARQELARPEDGLEAEDGSVPGSLLPGVSPIERSRLRERNLELAVRRTEDGRLLGPDGEILGLIGRTSGVPGSTACSCGRSRTGLRR